MHAYMKTDARRLADRIDEEAQEHSSVGLYSSCHLFLIFYFDILLSLQKICKSNRKIPFLLSFPKHSILL